MGLFGGKRRPFLFVSDQKDVVSSGRSDKAQTRQVYGPFCRRRRVIRLKLASHRGRRAPKSWAAIRT